jgi:hypothetical protein
VEVKAMGWHEKELDVISWWLNEFTSEWLCLLKKIVLRVWEEINEFVQEDHLKMKTFSGLGEVINESI